MYMDNNLINSNSNSNSSNTKINNQNGSNSNLLQQIDHNYIQKQENEALFVIHNDGQIVSRDKSKEFMIQRKKHVSKLNNDLDAIILKFKQVSMNVSTILQPEIENVNVCLLCYKTLSKAIQRSEFQDTKERVSRSEFVVFYEQMHLNILDLKRNVNQYKLIVNTIQDSGSPSIKRAKELESTINLHIKELKVGITKLKQIQATTPKQTSIIFNISHNFLSFLNQTVPEYRLYTTELTTRMQITPSSSPSSIKSPVVTAKEGSSPTSLSASPLTESLSASNRISSFFSSVFSSDNKQMSDAEYESTKDRSFILSVGPAVCALDGSYIAIQGENLDKPMITVTIGGETVKILKKNYHSLLLVGPKRKEEGEVDIVIKDHDYTLSKQSIFCTNSCFQTEKDIRDINNYASELYENASPSLSAYTKKHSRGLSGSLLANSQSANDDDDYDENVLTTPTTISFQPDYDDDQEENQEERYINELTNRLNSEPEPIYTTIGGKNSADNFDSIASSGPTKQDLVIQTINPAVSPMSGTRIEMNLKHALVAPITIAVGGVQAQGIEMTNQRKTISFVSPPSVKEGFHTIQCTYNGRYLEIPNVLVYYSSIPEASTVTSSSGSMTTTSTIPLVQSQSSSFVNNHSINNNNNSNITSSVNSPIQVSRSSRVWGK
ncbi:IPT/TIG domain-containing protein [Cavenderia fasciculata]|uniref:IPT/TIG domain-containing protein n=1 Tax=Cavenderia fasciculata TaxID=261658 RepID=F4PJU8_CACFS|nr:IPT/TIG domain-containing protein [Cavenderia fasciculata]EGG23872.1 IPT/TIG domain-containing protein [Cavenderia fasciculata]|eukprot:XP_004361723.1 IPT/TIG domain-containing protein [Cavenderia fasciculata]